MSAVNTPTTTLPIRSQRRRDLLVPVIPLLVSGAAASGFVAWVALTSGIYSDFAIFHDSARALREGRDLYFSPVTRSGWRNMSPPHFVPLIAPLAWLPIREAMMVWWLVTAAVMVGCVRLWRRVLPSGWALALFALLFASAAGYLNIRAGNQTWPTAMAVTWGWLAWRSGQYRRAAFVLGVVASLKVFALILLPYFCWRRRWPAAAWFLGGILVAIAFGLAVCGPAAYVSWLRVLSEPTWQGQVLNMSLLGGITRAFDAPHGSLRPIAVLPEAILPIWIIVAVGLAAVLWWKLRPREDADRDFAAILTAMLLVTPSGWVYYVPIAAGPLAAVTARARGSWLWITGTVLLLLPYPFAAAAPSATWATVTVASAYMWGGLLLLVATLRDP